MDKGKRHRRGGRNTPAEDAQRGRNRDRNRPKSGRGPGGSSGWIYGIHAVAAALGNPRREVRRLLVTRNAEDALRNAGITLPPVSESASPQDIEAVLGRDAVHQGAALQAEPLAPLVLDDVDVILNPDTPALVVVLDQVTDPHNVGAILRSAAAFGAAAIVTQDRHSPPETGSLAKAASGGLEAVPWVRVVNLARTLGELADKGFWRIGLDGEADRELADLDLGKRVVLVLGSEGKGMRHNTEAHVDATARLPISDKVESLNVSNAAAVALYELARRQ